MQTQTSAEPRTHGGALLTVLLVGEAMATMDNSIVAVAVPTIRRTLGAGDAAIQMIVAGYTLAFGVMVITGARLGDRFGHRRIFRLGLAGFTVVSAACGLAPDPESLVVARIVQGATGALMVPQVLSLIQLSFTGARRSRAIAIYSMVLALGVAAGQIIGGLVVAIDLAGSAWRPAFLLNVPVGAVLLLASGRHLPARTEGGAARLDLIGVIALSLAMVAVIGPIVVGRDQGWPPWLATGVLVAGFAGLAAFRGYEKRLTRRGAAPLVDFEVLRPPGIRSGLAACFMLMGCYTAFLFTLTLHLQTGLGFGPLRAGLAFVPYPAGFALLSLGAARLGERIQRRLPVAGPQVFALAVVLLGGLVVWREWSWVTVPLLFAAGAGHAAGFSTLFTRILARVEPVHAATLSGMGSTGTLLASVVGVAVVGSLYLAVAGDDPARSATGFAISATVLAAALLVGATGARRAMRGRRPALELRPGR